MRTSTAVVALCALGLHLCCCGDAATAFVSSSPGVGLAPSTSAGPSTRLYMGLKKNKQQEMAAKFAAAKAAKKKG